MTNNIKINPERVAVLRVDPAVQELYRFTRDEFGRVQGELFSKYLTKHEYTVINVFNRLVGWDKDEDLDFDFVVYFYFDKIYKVPKNAELLRSENQIKKFEVKLAQVSEIFKYYKLKYQ